MRTIQYTDDQGDGEILSITADKQGGGVLLMIEKGDERMEIFIDESNVMDLIHDLGAALHAVKASLKNG